ncbi:CO(2)-response secreted protease-like [Andrographis paniculata]|uniref:CO(2)-response secreted protease-like n=1 Tax=Andrographis paniculata TaxID=175694 RepID=UPI0021E7D499|nr:CO(2)-response secreted protease-like [Andrographis paniculata]
MRSLYFYFSLSLLLFLQQCHASQSEKHGAYIVYMGSSLSADGSPRNDYIQLLSSLTNRKNNPVIHTYSSGFSGFAAHLSDEEAKSIEQMPGVVSVFPDPVLQLHTTHSWKFLKHQASSLIDSIPAYPSGSGASSNETDTIIGFLDSGIWPESMSFDDKDVGEIPRRWKGKCMAGINFTASNCNKKLIGARYYKYMKSTPRDADGHGSHVASTAAGSPVPGASYYGLAKGTAIGGSTSSRIASYKVCGVFGCAGSDILKGFDDAIGDGVDVLSLSLGSDPRKEDLIKDPLAIGSFHAMEKGIIVVCSAGNDGPSASSVVNTAPWILTVAATTIDRDFEAQILLGGNKTIKGGAQQSPTPAMTMLRGTVLIKKPLSVPLCSYHANIVPHNKCLLRRCVPGYLDKDKVKGKIVLCENNPQEEGSLYNLLMKRISLMSQGALGVIIVDNILRQIPQNCLSDPISIVTEEDKVTILSYINSSRNPVATILQTVVTLNYKPAPVIAGFSSTGPVPGNKNLIKPDIAAPGVAILAAWTADDEQETLPGRKPPVYVLESGTSMSCPHVSGLAASVKSQHPTWSPSAIRSAIMTTAIQTDNLQTPIKTMKGSIATPYEIGAGVITISRPLQPGLIYETGIIDYLQFLCNNGYNADKIKKISHVVPSNFTCSSNSSDSISNMNYPSIAISNLKQNDIKTVVRTVANVGEEDSKYTAVVEAPCNVHVEVVPSKLEFSKGIKKLSYQVKFKLTAASKKDIFGSITWSNTKYKVRSPFVVAKA